MRAMSLSGLSKLVLGILLAAGILFGAGVALTRYLLERLATPPPRPVFANDPSPAPVSPVAATPSPAAPPDTAAPPSPETSPSPTDGYAARVTQPIGLILRDQPSREAGRIGGIEFNQPLTVLEDSPDGSWQRVRLGNGAEGWVRAGNTERLN